MTVSREPESSSAHDDFAQPYLKWSLIVGLAYAAIGVGTWFTFDDWPTRGQFGDMFGVANALFSGGALAGVVFTVLLQRRELQLQRLELELTRKELSRAAVAEEESAKQLLEQTKTQTKLLNAQLVTDRLEFFWRTYTPVTREQVDELKFHPEEYMDLSLYEARYKEDDVAIRKYIYMSMMYESLAFTRALHSHDVSDPMGRQWIETYTKDLVKSPEFLDVNDQYAEYYPEFRAYVDAIRESGVAPEERTN